MKTIDPCHAPVSRGVEHWNTLALVDQITTLDRLIAADMASGCTLGGWPVGSREDHPLEPILEYLQRTLAQAGGAL